MSWENDLRIDTEAHPGAHMLAVLARAGVSWLLRWFHQRQREFSRWADDGGFVPEDD